jgi:hypothetical protein
VCVCCVCERDGDSSMSGRILVCVIPPYVTSRHVMSCHDVDVFVCARNGVLRMFQLMLSM